MKIIPQAYHIAFSLFAICTLFVPTVYATTNSASFVAASSQFYRAADSVTLDQVTTGLTIEGWVYITDPTQPTVIISKRGTGGTKTYSMYVTGPDEAASKVEFYLADDGGFTSLPSLTSISANTWTHIAVTADGTNMKLFLNGVLDNSVVATRLPTVNANHLNMGAFAANDDVPSTQFLDGKLSMVRIWGVARTAPQILANYCTALGTTANLKAEWTLDNTANDNSGNSNTLTGTGSPTFGTSLPSPCASTPAAVQINNANVVITNANVSI